MICLVNFDEDSIVTPLPCDIRHYYHTNCIEQWLLINACCPLCKTEVTMAEIERVAKLYHRKLEQHSRCCSNKSGQRSYYSENQYDSYNKDHSSKRDSKGSPLDNYHDTSKNYR